MSLSECGGRICTVLDLPATGRLPQSGFVRQEDIPLKVFLENRFGQVYANPQTAFSISVWEAQDNDEGFRGPTPIGS
jgi:saccharopine dehydrogenase-like NADP-dependent oxidoreductase